MTAKQKQRKEEVDIDGYPTRPRNITNNAWLYETKAGLCVVQEHRAPDGSYLGSVQVTIPWGPVVKAVDHHKAVKGS
jgi:hypothetical protein